MLQVIAMLSNEISALFTTNNKHAITWYNSQIIIIYKNEDITIDVLRLPTKHCEYNPVEMIWSQIKGYVASHNV